MFGGREGVNEKGGGVEHLPGQFHGRLHNSWTLWRRRPSLRKGRQAGILPEKNLQHTEHPQCSKGYDKGTFLRAGCRSKQLACNSVHEVQSGARGKGRWLQGQTACMWLGTAHALLCFTTHRPMELGERSPHLCTMQVISISQHFSALIESPLQCGFLSALGVSRHICTALEK